MIYLHRSQRFAGGVDIFECHESLAPHFEGFERDDIEDRTKLREDGIQRLFELLFLHFLVEVVYVDRVVRSHIHLAGLWVNSHLWNLYSDLRIAGSTVLEVLNFKLLH